MKKLLFPLLVVAAAWCAPEARATVPAYDQEAALAAAKADVANWMKYLPDEVFVAHVSIPGTHDTATAEGWVSSSGPTYSTTQAVTIDEQLAKGVRAFDFRPGLVSNELWCNHGTSQTTLKLADAFAKLTNYLDAHPSEFFVIHLFRGNVPNAGTNLSGGANSDSDREKYNNLINELFNKQLDRYIIDYTPYLKVSDMRGKMVVFRRDRIAFAYIAKAGNLTGWPGDEDQWHEGQIVSVENASNKAYKGEMYATDVSSPDDQATLNIELTSLTDLFAKSKSQPYPNDAKKLGAYKPYWVMPFTSGCYGKFPIADQTTGYEDNATYTNPHFTSLLRTAQADGTTGPAGTVFSDWVLVDTQNKKSVMGVDLIPAIYENNFYYIKNFILDDELFTAEAAENFWTPNTKYFMRNVGAGQYLAAGAWWSTRLVLSDHPQPVKMDFEQQNAAYKIITNFNQGNVTNGIGADFYIDNTAPILLTAKYLGGANMASRMKAMASV